jgi:2-oxoglutarate dehydrogenase complex dehydrogenase (E1) component-like enzyme
MSPKSMLRLPEASSNISEITSGAFKKVIYNSDSVKPEKIQKLLFCSGKVYYDLVKGIAESKKDDITIVRVEQLYPFPDKELKEALDYFPKAKSFVWVQEEPKNQGSWHFIRDRLESLLPNNSRLGYAGRKESASPAAGHLKVHNKEQIELVKEALS